MIREKMLKLPKIFFISYLIFLLFFLGLWLISTELNYIPVFLLVLGLLLPLLGLFLSYFLKQMLEGNDPQTHFLVVLNIVTLLMALLLFVVSLLIFYSDTIQSDVGDKYNVQLNALIEAGDVNECVNFLLSDNIVTETEAVTTCNLRIAIATNNKELCDNIPDNTTQEICITACQ